MSTFRTSNPMFNESAFEPASPYGNLERAAQRATVMTVQGAVNSTAILLSVVIGVGGLAWWMLPQMGDSAVYGGTVIGSLLGFVLCLVVSFKKEWSPYLALPIAVCEGVLAGGASLLWSAYAEHSARFSALGAGLVLQAAILTVGVTGCLLIAYSTRLIRATEKFKLGVVAATGGLCVLCLVSLVLNLVGIQIPYIWGNGIIGISFAAVVVVIAALNLVLDFDFIEQGAAARLPKHMEWYAAVGLLVTLVWLYVSILRLLAKISSRR
jgi:uncharacterized YccA/Bax inhibitor family protein